MNCEKCASETHVIDTRKASGMIRRRRECEICDHRFTTLEIPARLVMERLISNGQAEDLKKLIAQKVEEAMSQAMQSFGLGQEIGPIRGDRLLARLKNGS